MTPDATKHNPDPTYLRSLIKAAGYSVRGAARQIGVPERTLHWYLYDGIAPYCVQYALESLGREAG